MLRTLSETSHSKKTHAMCIYSYEILRVIKLIEIENRMIVARGWVEGGRNGKLLFDGYRVSVLQDEKVLEIFIQQSQYN